MLRKSLFFIFLLACFANHLTALSVNGQAFLNPPNANAPIMSDGVKSIVLLNGSSGNVGIISGTAQVNTANIYPVPPPSSSAAPGGILLSPQELTNNNLLISYSVALDCVCLDPDICSDGVATLSVAVLYQQDTNQIFKSIGTQSVTASVGQSIQLNNTFTLVPPKSNQPILLYLEVYPEYSDSFIQLNLTSNAACDGCTPNTPFLLTVETIAK